VQQAVAEITKPISGHIPKISNQMGVATAEATTAV